VIDWVGDIEQTSKKVTKKKDLRRNLAARLKAQQEPEPSLVMSPRLSASIGDLGGAGGDGTAPIKSLSPMLTEGMGLGTPRAGAGGGAYQRVKIPKLELDKVMVKAPRRRKK